MNLLASRNLKELPDLSNATNLQELNLGFCESLVEIPSSFQHLQKLQKLVMQFCSNLQVTPPHLNLASLEYMSMKGCSKLRNFSVISANFKSVDISETLFEDVPPSISLCSRLGYLIISGNLKGITHLPMNLWCLNLRDNDIERIPDCIKALHLLQYLCLYRCRRLAALPELPSSLLFINAGDCESLETVSCPLTLTRGYGNLDFTNCFKLGEQAKREIIQSSFFGRKALLPGKEVPAKFDQRAKGNTLTILLDGNNPLSALSRFKLCVVLSPKHQIRKYSHHLLYRGIVKGDLDPVEEEFDPGYYTIYRGEHLFIFDSELPFIDPSQVSREIVFEFSSKSHDFDIIECGAHIWIDETMKGSYESGSDQVFEDGYAFEHSESFEDDTNNGDHTNGVVICDEDLQGEGHTDCWSWLFLCFDLSHFVRNIRNLASGRRR